MKLLPNIQPKLLVLDNSMMTCDKTYLLPVNSGNSLSPHQTLVSTRIYNIQLQRP